jgi:tetratricopeptide (TPR) repeat protein
MSDALQAFDGALRSPNGFGNPFLHLRRGQVLFELGRREEAANELTRAYGLEGEQIFEEEHPKYLNFLQRALRASPPSSEHKSWWRFW